MVLLRILIPQPQPYNQVRDEGGLDAILRALGTMTEERGVVKAALACVFHLADTPANQDALREAGALQVTHTQHTQQSWGKSVPIVEGYEGWARIPRRPLEVNEGNAARRIQCGLERRGRRDIDMCVGGRGTHSGRYRHPTHPKLGAPPGEHSGQRARKRPAGSGRAQPGHPPAAALRRPHLLTTAYCRVGVSRGARRRRSVAVRPRELKSDGLLCLSFTEKAESTV